MSIDQNTALLVYCCCVAALLGAVFGSFLHCAGWRLARGESFLKGRSHCPSCGHVLGAGDLVPVFSWMFLKGKCRYCGAKIPARYMLSELLFAAVSVACLLRFDLTWLCLRNWAFFCCLFCLSVTDLDNFTIPDGCLIAAAVIWVLFLPLLGTGWGEILRSLAAGLVFGGGLLAVSLVMDRVLKRDSLGGGDIKLFAVLGLYLGFAGCLFTLLLACVLGLLAGRLRRSTDGERGQIPFGPPISAAAVLMMLFGNGLIQWYLGLF